jgi:hypothetical protein
MIKADLASERAMAVATKLPPMNPDRETPVYAQKPRGFWYRWNKQASLVAFVIGLGVLWLIVSLLLVIEIQ